MNIYNVIILDESGSMSSIYKPTIQSMNEVISGIRKSQNEFPEQRHYVTIVTFEGSGPEGVKTRRDRVPVQTVEDFTEMDYCPGGCTPLYDAMGLSISKLNAMVESDDKVLVTVITDGEENCSTEWTLKMIRTLIEKLKKENWTFTLIGTDNLDVEGMARSMAIDEHLEFQEDAEGTRMMFERESRARSRYMCRVAACEEAPTGSFFSES